MKVVKEEAVASGAAAGMDFFDGRRRGRWRGGEIGPLNSQLYCIFSLLLSLLCFEQLQRTQSNSPSQGKREREGEQNSKKIHHHTKKMTSSTLSGSARGNDEGRDANGGRHSGGREENRTKM